MTIATDELLITGMNFPPYSTRGATQTLTPIDAQTQLARTVNGVLVDLSDPDGNFKKFKSSINCTDQQLPEWVWPGSEVTVHCIHELCYKTVGGSQIRDAVEGSSRVDGDYTFYRPVLIMRVLTWANVRDDWNASNQWQIDLEESQFDGMVT